VTDWLGAGSPALAPTTDLAAARMLLAGWSAPSAEQAAVRDRIVAFVDEYPGDAHERSCVPGHLTASCMLVDHAGERVLLTLHRKLERWLQLGGHCDGDANLAGAAFREAVEESGIEELEIAPVPIDVDIHPIPARKADPEHLHLDTRFLVRAPEGAEPRISEESTELRWFTIAEARTLDLDDSVTRLLDLLERD
jgi:8-oxo-dGTP pyrophosphatase MutT (NUDIX family)